MRGDEAAGPQGPTDRSDRAWASYCQTMSSQVGPGTPEQRPGADKPFIHDVKPDRSEDLREFCCARDRGAHVVEPDGIEPTTSCLQSTRSTN